MKEPVRDILLSMAGAVGLYRVFRTVYRDSLLVLTYHSVVDVDEEVRARHPSMYRNAVTARQFEQHLRFLRAHYQILGPDVLEEGVRRGTWPERAVVITFDDGLLNNATVAWPILERLGVPALFFLPTAFVDAASQGSLHLHWTEEVTAYVTTTSAGAEGARRLLHEMGQPVRDEQGPGLADTLIRTLKALPSSERMDYLSRFRQTLGESVDAAAFPADKEGHSILATMTWDHAQTLADAGHEIGSHTVEHSILSRIPMARAKEEIRESAAMVEKHTGRPCRFFTYPNGGAEDFTMEHQQVLRNAGYAAAFSQLPGFNAGDADRFTLRRINVPGDCGMLAFKYRTSGLGLVKGIT